LAPQAVAAGPALLVEASSGKVLYAEEIDRRWHPASLTKIMTAYLTFEALKSGKLSLDSKISCSWLAHQEQPSKIGLPIGAKISVRLALDALIVKSANDVAIMLAEAIGGTHDAFVARMNATARRLGMTRTHYDNPNGLPSPGQITTARDLAKLSRAILRDFPEYAYLWKKRSFRIGRRRIGGHNGLLTTFKGADGLKTGFICDSGYNVVASATRDGRKLLAVVLGATSGHNRSIRATSLLEHGFRIYGWKQFFNTDNIDNLPMARLAGKVASIRKQVHSRACGYYRPRHRRRHRRKARRVARKKVTHSRKKVTHSRAKAVRKRRAKYARTKRKSRKRPNRRVAAKISTKN